MADVSAGFVAGRIIIDQTLKAGVADGLLRFSFVLTTAGKNLNNQVFLDEDLRQEAVYKSPIGQPIDIDHLQGFDDVCGEMYDSTYIKGNGVTAGRIKSFGIILANVYPKVAEKVRLGAGRWAAVSMEAFAHPLETVGKDLIVHKPSFIGAGLVRFPACLESHIDDVDGIPTSTPEPSVEAKDRLKALQDRIQETRIKASENDVNRKIYIPETVKVQNKSILMAGLKQYLSKQEKL